MTCGAFCYRIEHVNVYDRNPASRYDLSQVGDGYRNACWVQGSTFGGKRGTGYIYLYGYDKAGNRRTFKFPFYPSVKFEVRHQTTERDLYGKCIETRWFDTPYDRKQWCLSMEDKVRIISCYPPEQEFLLTVFGSKVFNYDREKDKITLNEAFNTQPIRTHYIDIEVAIENEFPEPEFAKYPINLITVYDTQLEKFVSWALDMTIENTLAGEMPIELRKFADEKDMLSDFLAWHNENSPDYISGWNVKGFDVIYIVNRLIKVFGKEKAYEYSPARRIRISEDKKNYGKKFASISGVSVLDMLFLYRDKFGIKQALDGGYNLNNVSLVELEDAKVHYDGTMLDFYKQNFQKFWEYNVQDVNLVVKLDRKCKLLQVARMITSFGCSPAESIYATISYIIASMDIFSRKRFGKVFLSYSKSSTHGAEVDQYQGAFVFPTYMGLYIQGVMVVDVNSLYPNTARSLNLSPETLVGELVKLENEAGESLGKYRIVFVDGRSAEVDQHGLDQLLATKCILSRNNMLFLKHEVCLGIFSEWCGTFFTLRKGVKGVLAETEDRMDAMDKEAEHALFTELETKAENLDSRQYALKIMINSAYGTTGTTYSPIYDTRLAEAITCGGQFCNRSTAEFIKDVFQKEYGVGEDFHTTISGDTDSVTGDMELEVELDDSLFSV